MRGLAEEEEFSSAKILPVRLAVVSELYSTPCQKKTPRSRAERGVRHDTWVRKANGSTHIVPHNVMFRILRRDLLQAACLGRSNAANFGTCGKRVDSTNEYIKVVLIFSDLAGSRCCSSALMAASCCRRNAPSVASRGTHSDLSANLGNGKATSSTRVTC